MPSEQNVKITITAEDKASGPIKNVQSSLGGLEKATTKVGGVFTSIGHAAEVAMGVMANSILTYGISAIQSLSQEMVKLSLEQTKLQLQTSTLFKNIGLQKYAEEVGQVILKHEQMSSFDGQSVQASLNDLIAVTKDWDSTLRLLTAAEDLAAAKGIDLQSATKQIITGLEGSTKGLQKYGVELDEVIWKSLSTAQKTRYLASEIEKSFGGSAETLRNSTAGIFANFQNQIQNLKSLFGDEITQAIAPTLETIANKISALISSGQLQPLLDSFGNLLSKLVGVGTELGKIIMQLMGASNLSESINKIADAFDRVSYILGVIENVLARVSALVKDLHLDVIMDLGMRAISPGSMYLWDYAGQQVANQKATTPQLQLTKMETKPKATDTAAEALERLREGIRVENESKTKKVENTLATINNTIATQTSSEYLGFLRDRTSETSKQVEILGQTAGGAISFMNDAMNSVRQMLSGGARTSKSSGCGKCPTFTSGERVEAGVDIVYEGPDRGGRGIYTPVPDALITKRGDIVKFHPEDNILAFKDPAAVRGKGGNISVTINVNGSRDPDAIADEILRRINRITRVGF